MPSRSRKKLKQDLSEDAADNVVPPAETKAESGPADIGAAPEREKSRKELMRELGRKRGKLSGDPRPAYVAREARRAISRRVVTAKWKK